MKKVLAMVLTLCLLGGLSMGFAAAEEVVTLRWVAVGNGMPTNYDAWLAQINPSLEEKIGVNIEMEIVGWGDWDTRRSVIINTGEPVDIIFGNMNVYNSDVAIGAYLDIGELLQTSAPDLYAMIPESYWDACRVNGKIYAVPTYKDSSISQYFVWDKGLVDKLGLDVSGLNTLESLTPALTAIKDSGEISTAAYPLSKSGATYLMYEYDQMSTGLPAIGVYNSDESAKVVPVFEQADIQADMAVLRQWYLDGIINSDAATLPEDNKYKACAVAQGWPSAAVTTWGPNMGVEAVAYQWKNTLVSNESVRGSLNSISVNCEHPEKALEFLQLINTDSYVRDSFYYGVEGDNWTYTDDGRVHQNNSDWSMAGYTQATFFNVTPNDAVEFNEWDEVKALNEKAIPSVLLGFTFDTTEVQDKIANCIVIYERYKGELLTGTIDPVEGVAAMMTEMRAAGFDDIVAAAQTQVDAFMAAK
jgi:putative aldouronate transport system substrate-binding protein